MKRHLIVFALLACGMAPPALAQEWAQKMFQTTSYDFGTVAKDAKTEFRFELRNPYVEDVHIASVRTSCGCTTPLIEKQTLKTHEKGAIVAHFNTDRFVGQRGATLTVTIDRPFFAEVQLQVKGNIQPDVVVTPGSVAFGTVKQGTAWQQRVRVQVPAYRQFQVQGVRTGSDYLQAKVTPVRDQLGNTAYELLVRLSEKAPAGPFQERLLLVANDGVQREIPVLVEGQVKPAGQSVTVSPASLVVVVQPGQSVQKQVVLKGDRPFRIKSITANDQRIQFGSANSQEAKALHLIPVTFNAGDQQGRIEDVIKILTDIDGREVALPATAMVTAQ